jgi:hypothetical protein
MKKMIANVILASMLFNGVAFAQSAPIDPNQWAGTFTAADCVKYPVVCAAIQPDPPPPATKPWNRRLGIVGVGTMIVGGALMIPWGSPGDENWKLFGRDTCVTYKRSQGNEFNIRDGECVTQDPQILNGLITLGVGAALTWIGFRKVVVKPTLTWDDIEKEQKARYGASATVTW